MNLFVRILFIVVVTECSTHWKRQGGHIVNQRRSLVHLARPHSFMDFYDQEKTMQELYNSEEDLYKLGKSLREREKVDDPSIEEKIMRTDADCQIASHELKSSLFFTEYPPSLMPELAEHVSLEAQAHAPWFLQKECLNEIPDCKAIYKMDYSPYSFEHLDSMQRRQDLKMQPVSKEYRRTMDHILYFKTVTEWDKEYDIPETVDGPKHTITGTDNCFLYSNMHNPNPSVRSMVSLHYFAVTHWMYRGNAPQAFECMRTLLHHSNTHDLMHHSNIDWKPMVLLLFGNLLTLTQQYEDASIVLELAHLYSTSYAQRILTSSALGDSLALSANFSHAISLYTEAYELVLKTDDAFPITDENAIFFMKKEEEVKRKRASLLCNTKIRNELEAQYENLQEYLREGQKYQFGNERNERITKSLKSRIANKSDVAETTLFYDQMMYGWNLHRDCRIIVEKGKGSRMTCGIVNQKHYTLYDTTMSKHREKTNKNLPKINQPVWKQAEIFTRDRSFTKRLEKFSNTEMDEGHIPPKYPLPSSLVSNIDRYWRKADWPSSNDCDSILFHSDLSSISSIPQIFVSPEEKGFLISELLTKMLGLEMEEEHPLPWDEPRCNDDIAPTRIVKLEGISRTLGLSRSDKWMEGELKGVLVRLAERRMNEAEMGQRIYSLMIHNIGPRWISRNLATLYWRVVGNPSQAVKCALSALQYSDEYRDVALIQLAQIVHRSTSLKRDAQLLYQLAIAAANQQPQAHYLLGRLYLVMNEVDKGVGSLKASLDRNPFDSNTIDHLLTVVCNGQPSKPGVRDRYPTICCSLSIQNAVCHKSIYGDHCFTLEKDNMDNDIFVYSRCNRKYTGVSYAPPAVLHLLSPFLPIYSSIVKKDESYLIEEPEGVQLIHSEEIPLDHGGPDAYQSYTPHEWYKSAKRLLVYFIEEEEKDDIELEIDYSQPIIPHKPLSLLWITQKSEMLTYDVALPEILPTPSMTLIRTGLGRFPPPRSSPQLCSGVPKIESLLDTQVSTWLSVSAKGADVEKYIDVLSTLPRGLQSLSPDCPNPSFSPFKTLDHLPFAPLSDQFLFYKSEKALTDALLAIGRKETVDGMGARLGQAIRSATASGDESEIWLPAVVSALYWRVVGDSQKAVTCLRLALATAPPNMRDVALVSLANVCHQAGLLHSALITAGAALDVSPSLVAIHFTIANIYSSIGDFERALNFYYSTIALQSSFEPAKERVRAIYCYNEGEKYNRHLLI